MQKIKLKDVKPGSQLIADNGFDCIEAFSKRTVFQDNDGRLYVCCSHGHHGLDGQLENYGELGDDDYLVGLYDPTPPISNSTKA